MNVYVAREGVGDKDRLQFCSAAKGESGSCRRDAMGLRRFLEKRVPKSEPLR